MSAMVIVSNRPGIGGINLILLVAGGLATTVTNIECLYLHLGVIKLIMGRLRDCEREPQGRVDS